MNELSDWIWLAVAGIWIIARVLPRLFRARAGESAETPLPEASEPPEPSGPAAPKSERPQPPIEPK